MSKSFIFLVKPFLGNFYRHLAIFIWSHWLQIILSATHCKLATDCDQPERACSFFFFFSTGSEYRWLQDGLRLSHPWGLGPWQAVANLDFKRPEREIGRRIFGTQIQLRPVRRRLVVGPTRRRRSCSGFCSRPKHSTFNAINLRWLKLLLNLVTILVAKFHI